MAGYICEDTRKVTTHRFLEMKGRGEKISMLTSYDFTTAGIVDGAGIDAILVGDSASNVMLGNVTTLPITVDEMIVFGRSVVKAVKRALVVIDMPFGAYQSEPYEGVRNAIRIMKETGADAVKMEGGEEVIDVIGKIVNAGIPVMGHLGLMPQSINKYGSYAVRAKDDAEAEKLIHDAHLLEEAGLEVPKTWDEFDAALEKLDAAGIQPMATGGSDKWLATRLINAYAVRTLGNDIMTKAANGEVPYTDEGLVAAADKLASWADAGYFGEGVTTVDANTAASMLMNGQAAIFYTGSWLTQNLTDPTQNTAGEDGIGFFNIPVYDESISSSTSYSMNCGNILAMDKAKLDEGTAWFMKYFIENMGNVAMEELGTVKGYTYTTSTEDMDPYTQLVLDEIAKATEGFAWWEAKMNAEVSSIAQENVQPLLNGDMTGQEYMQSIQDAYDMSN